MTWPSPSLPLPTDQTNATVQFDRHPTEHSTIGQVINNDIAPRINDMGLYTTNRMLYEEFNTGPGVINTPGDKFISGFDVTHRANTLLRITAEFNWVNYNQLGQFATSITDSFTPGAGAVIVNGYSDFSYSSTPAYGGSRLVCHVFSAVTVPATFCFYVNLNGLTSVNFGGTYVFSIEDLGPYA